MLMLSICRGQFGPRDCCQNKCECEGNIINCDDKNLTTVPACSDSEVNGRTTMLLSQNNLGRFELGNIHSKIINVIARDSHITHIGVDASKNADIKKLDVRGNMLKEISELGHLRNLVDLDVSLNPIPDSAFSASVMRSLGSTLRTIHIGNEHMNQFPRGISEHLQFLTTLDVNGASPLFAYLPPNAFRSFNSRLENLTIRNTHLQAMPLALKDLSALNELHFDGNPIGDYGVLPESLQGLNRLTKLSLNRDQLTQFPQIVDKLPNLDSLSLDGNRLLYIREAAVDMVNNSRIRTLSLANCSLDRIPGAIAFSSGNYLNNLVHLNLDHNNIQSIDRNDLHDLKNLESITLVGNSLQYISEHAFWNMSKLSDINLEGTQMREIPSAIENIVDAPIVNINMNGTKVECTCSLVDFQKIYVARSDQVLHIAGECDTIHQTIHDYLTNRVPNCPDY